jgi:hypothetical protein
MDPMDPMERNGVVLGRKDYRPEEMARAKAAVDQQLKGFRTATTAAAATGKAKMDAQDFEAMYFNSMALALDRPFVHRLRMVTGKDTNPLNELELLVDSLMNNDGVLRTNSAIKYVPEESVLKLRPGDAIRLTADDFERLAAAFFDALEDKYA